MARDPLSTTPDDAEIAAARDSLVWTISHYGSPSSDRDRIATDWTLGTVEAYLNETAELNETVNLNDMIRMAERVAYARAALTAHNQWKHDRRLARGEAPS